jgi:hypothetical protein
MNTGNRSARICRLARERMRCCCGRACGGPEGGEGHVRLIVSRLERLSHNVHFIAGRMMPVRCAYEVGPKAYSGVDPGLAIFLNI